MIGLSTTSVCAQPRAWPHTDTLFLNVSDPLCVQYIKGEVASSIALSFIYATILKREVAYSDSAPFKSGG